MTGMHNLTNISDHLKSAKYKILRVVYTRNPDFLYLWVVSYSRGARLVVPVEDMLFSRRQLQ